MARTVRWEGDYKGLNPKFRARLAQAVYAAGGTVIYVTSGYRSPSKNRAVGGVQNSNHMSGHAADGYAIINGRQVMLGDVPGLASSGLRSGDQPGFYHGGRDPVHVDDGFNVHGGAANATPSSNAAPVTGVTRGTGRSAPAEGAAASSLPDFTTQTEGAATGPSSLDPGSVSAEGFTPQLAAQLWETIASQPNASQDSKWYAQQASSSAA